MAKNKTRITPSTPNPLLPDELAMLPEVAATQDVPKEIAVALATGRLDISSPQQPSARSNRNGKESKGEWSIDLPPGALLGRAGLSGKRVAREASKAKAASISTPMCPAWAAQSFQPRVASDRAVRVPMQRLKGTQVEPYSGVYPPDDRVVYFPSSYPWRCIGRIFTWTNWAGGGGWNWWGSGVLVGPRHVLTAGHVCPWGREAGQ
jgi:V8-like Glu-specific endopeptidase